jgi:hypothetical protein
VPVFKSTQLQVRKKLTWKTLTKNLKKDKILCDRASESLNWKVANGPLAVHSLTLQVWTELLLYSGYHARPWGDPAIDSWPNISYHFTLIPKFLQDLATQMWEYTVTNFNFFCVTAWVQEHIENTIWNFSFIPSFLSFSKEKIIFGAYQFVSFNGKDTIFI